MLTALVDHGMARDDAYAAVQRAATDAWDRGVGFRERMREEISASGVLDEAAFAELFRVEPYLANLDGVFERLEKLPVEEA